MINLLNQLNNIVLLGLTLELVFILTLLPIIISFKLHKDLVLLQYPFLIDDPNEDR